MQAQQQAAAAAAAAEEREVVVCLMTDASLHKATTMLNSHSNTRLPPVLLAGAVALFVFVAWCLMSRGFLELRKTNTKNEKYQDS